MRKDKRKSRRRPIRYSAWMALDDDKLHGCVLADISDTGARLDVEDSKALPDRFMLLLSGTGSARRSCRVIWRAAAQIGVAFEKRPGEPLRRRWCRSNADRGTQPSKTDAEPVETA